MWCAGTVASGLARGPWGQRHGQALPQSCGLAGGCGLVDVTCPAGSGGNGCARV